MGSKARLETGCVLLFALPFVLVVLATVVLFVSELRVGRGESAMPLVLVVMGSSFALLGTGLVWLVLRGRKAARLREESRAAHPEEPWLWRPEWVGGRVRCSSRASALALGLIATFWMLLSAPVAWFLVAKEAPERNELALFGLALPAIGLLLMGWAAVAILRWRKYGASVFEMSGFPGVIGGTLEGTVQVGARVEALDDLTASLRCVERTVTGSGRNRSTREAVLWEDESTIPIGRMERSRTATAIPVRFRVPFECRSSETLSPRSSIVWRLALHADTEGADYDVSFEVPVYKTPASSPAPPPEVEDPAVAGVAATPPRDPRVHVNRLVGGRLELHFPVLRHPALSLGLGAFVAGWWGAAFLLARSDAPVVFPIVFSLFGLLLTGAWFGLSFASSHVVADRDHLTATRSWFGIFSKTRIVPSREVEGLRLTKSFESGGTRQVSCLVPIQKLGLAASLARRRRLGSLLEGLGHQPRRISSEADPPTPDGESWRTEFLDAHYLDLEAALSGGKSLTLGTALRSRREAEWLKAQLEEALGGAPPP